MCRRVRQPQALLQSPHTLCSPPEIMPVADRHGEHIQKKKLPRHTATGLRHVGHASFHERPSFAAHIELPSLCASRRGASHTSSVHSLSSSLANWPRHPRKALASDWPPLQGGPFPLPLSRTTRVASPARLPVLLHSLLDSHGHGKAWRPHACRSFTAADTFATLPAQGSDPLDCLRNLPRAA